MLRVTSAEVNFVLLNIVSMHLTYYILRYYNDTKVKFEFLTQLF